MLTGILVDVSGSMKKSLQLNAKVTDENVTRAESIFTTIIKIAEREVKSDENQQIFVLAFGLPDVYTCDLLSLLEKAEKIKERIVIGYDPLIELLKENGAPHASEYIKKNLIEEEAGFLYDFYSTNLSLLSEIVDDLPIGCKDGLIAGATRGFTNVLSFLDPTSTVSSHNNIVARKNADRAIHIAKFHIHKSRLSKLKTIKDPKNKTLKETIDLLHKVAGTNPSKDKRFSSAQLSNLLTLIEPDIYGQTSMCEAIRSAIEMFNKSGHDDNVLFILTDGEATDGNPVQFAEQLGNKKVDVFVCLLTSQNISHPKRLYYESKTSWTQAQRNMFELSSTVENTHSAMSILLEQGWELDTAGHSRLFVQANHPNVIDEFTSLTRRMIENNDALLNIFGRVTLDQYINSAISTFIPNEQIGGTCYANAIAAVFHLAMKRIEGREGGVPEFKNICDILIANYGVDGAYVENVLRTCSPKYRLQYKKVDENGARNAINARRPVIATFSLFKKQWKAFSEFYMNNPLGILEYEDLTTNGASRDLSGHAVVLIKCDPISLTFMNSWGTKFADEGFFRVKNQSVLFLKFFDVFWTLNDLKPNEIKAFNEKKNQVGQAFLKKLPISIQNFPYECLKCKRSSPASKFIGHLLEAKCPKCKQNFKPTPLGLVLDSYTY